MDVILGNMKSLLPFVIIPWAWLLIRVWRKPQKYFNSMLLMIACFFTMFFIAGMFGDYMGYALLAMFLIVMVILFLVPLILVINGIVMIKNESLAVAHLLSLALGLVIGIGEIATVFFVFGTTGIGFFAEIHKLSYFTGATVFYFSVLILNFVFYCIFIQFIPYGKNLDYIIIHGCGLADGHRVTKLLSNRIDKAMEVYHKCGDKPMLIASGGRGSDESISEAEAISTYLREHGIPENHIILEDKSATTMENLLNSKGIISRLEGGSCKGKRIALVSNNYHIYRCLSYARSIKMKCIGIGAKVALYFWPTALIREFVAVFTKPKFFIISMIGYAIFVLPVIAM